jgi:hypothetical protein
MTVEEYEQVMKAKLHYLQNPIRVVDHSSDLAYV